MRKILDCRNRCVCYADDTTGRVEQKYKDIDIVATVSVGDRFIVTRDSIKTILFRADDNHFCVDSYKVA